MRRICLLSSIIFLQSCWLAETETRAAEPAAPKESATYDTPVRSSAELKKQVVAACQQAKTNQTPVLIEFSAPWCGDCKRLHQMKQEAGLKAELSKWPVVVVNVGQFDKHVALQKAFNVSAIANWAIVMTPSSCDTTLVDWPRLAQRTLEPRSGTRVSPQELTSWLAAARTAMSGPKK